jgi:hypothetical protein
VKALGYLLQKEKSQNKYIQSYLTFPNGSEGDWDSGPNALRASLNREWKERIKRFESYAADIEKRARAASVPIVVVMVPTRAQAAMISLGKWPDGFDPFALDKKVGSIIMEERTLIFCPIFALHPTQSSIFICSMAILMLMATRSSRGS